MTQNFGYFYSPEHQEKIQQAKAIENKIARKIAWKKIGTSTGYNISKKDGKLHFSETSYTPSIGVYGQIYMQRKTESGFTFDGKKVRFWFGDRSCLLKGGYNNFELLLNALGIDWLLSKRDSFITTYALAKATTLAKILSFKITNFTDLTMFVIKSSKLRCSVATFEKYATDNSSFYYLKKISRLTENVDENAKVYFSTDHYGYGGTPIHILRDILDQAETLEEKVDLRWSSKRLNEVHTDFTRRLMFYETEAVPEDYFGIPIVQNIADSQGIEYITNSKRLYTESYMMKHCVYTSYADPARRKQYLVFHIDGYTLGLRFNKSLDSKVNSLSVVAEWDQLYGKFNSSPDDKTTAIAERFVEELNNVLQEENCLRSV